MTFLELSGAWSLQIIALEAGAEAFAPLLRRAHPRVRARYWSFALALALTAPWLISASSAPMASGQGGVLIVASEAVGRTLGAVDPWWQASLLALWSTGALAGLVRLAHGLRRLHRIARDSRPVLLGMSPLLRVHETGLVRSPAASFIGRIVLVPTGFPGLPESWKKAALAHESIHLSRGHGVLLLVEEVILSLFWFHPLVFRLIRRVRDSREEMVDAATIEAVGSSRDYRDMLIGLAARLTIPAPAVSGTTALRSRIESLIVLEENPMPVSRLRLLIAGLALLGTASLAASGAPLQTAADKSKASQPPRKVISKVNPAYPSALKERKISGVVQLVVVVDEAGAVISATARPEDNPDLAKAAIDAVRQWRYEPGKGETKLTHAFDFRLTAEKEKK